MAKVSRTLALVCIMHQIEQNTPNISVENFQTRKGTRLTFLERLTFHSSSSIFPDALSPARAMTTSTMTTILTALLSLSLAAAAIQVKFRIQRFARLFAFECSHTKSAFS